MTISRYAEVTDAVLAALRESTALNNVEVVDGPPRVGQFPPDAVYIGWSGEDESDYAGSITQSYHDLGPAATRDERVEIACSIHSTAGDDDMAQCRSRAVTTLGVVESVLRSTVGLGVGSALRVEFSDATVRQIRSSDGIGFQLSATITATSLI